MGQKEERFFFKEKFDFFPYLFLSLLYFLLNICIYE